MYYIVIIYKGIANKVQWRPGDWRYHGQSKAFSPYNVEQGCTDDGPNCSSGSSSSTGSSSGGEDEEEEDEEEEEGAASVLPVGGRLRLGRRRRERGSIDVG